MWWAAPGASCTGRFGASMLPYRGHSRGRRSMRPGQFVSRAAFPVIFALIRLALPASAGAKNKVLSPASYPDTTTGCRTDAITIHPGQNLNLVGATKTCPNAEVVRGPGGPGVFSPGSTAEGYVTRSSPARRSSGRQQAGDPERVGPAPPPRGLDRAGRPDVRLRRGRRSRHCPGYGLGRRGRHLGAQLHDPQPDRRRGRQVYVVDDRLGPGGEPLGRRHPVGQDRVARRRGTAADLPRVRRRAWVRRERGRQVRVPGRVPDDPAAAGFEGGADQPAREWTVPDGGATLVSGAGHLHPGGLHVDLEVARDGPAPERSTATSARRLRSCSAPTRTTTIRPAP